jgi:exodeoxyribonuclease V alpha subunit
LKESVNCENYREERGDEFVKIDNQGLSKSFFSFVERYRFYIQEKDPASALQKLDILRVLCSTRSGKLGVEALNQVIELFLKDNFELKPKNGFYHNQPIMITQNNTGLKLFNGDVGLVREVSNNELFAYFIIDSKLESIPVALIKEYQTVFAMTIHKSQGSEFDSVVVAIPSNTEKMKVSKELLYTGVTRAKKQVLLLASDKAIDDAIHFSVKRTSGLKQRLTT